NGEINEVSDMVSNSQLNRINELAKKAKSTGLGEQEKQEQKELREAYLKEFRQSFKEQIEHTTVIDPKGKDVTPEKLKKKQKSLRNKKYKEREISCQKQWKQQNNNQLILFVLYQLMRLKKRNQVTRGYQWEQLQWLIRFLQR